MRGRWHGIIAFTVCLVLLTIIQAVPEQPMLLAERYLPGSGWLEVLLLAGYAAWLAGRLAEPAEVAMLRPRIWLLFSLVFFAQLAMGLAGMEKMLMTGKLHLPIPAMIIAGPLYRGKDFFMPIMFLTTVFLTGSAWCSHLCYIGAWDDLCSRHQPVVGKLPSWWRAARLIVLAAVVFLALLLKVLHVGSAFAFLAAAGFGMAGVAIMVLVSRKIGLMAHCTMFCPIGLLGNWLGRLSFWRMKIDANCSGCMQCRKKCRYSALEPENIRERIVGASCTLCGDCLAACHGGHIGYWLPFAGRTTARSIFVIMITVLHVLFLSVARI